MQTYNVLQKNRTFYRGVYLTIIEGILSGSNFILLYEFIKQLWEKNIDMSKIMQITSILVVIFILRLFVYSKGYIASQIGGAEVSKNLRLFLGDKIKRIPLARFTKSQTGEYINTVTLDINNYEQILTHKIGDIAKNISLSIMLILFITYLYPTAGIILLVCELMLIPAMSLSFKMVKKYGSNKSKINAEHVSSIVEYVSGIQSFRAYGIGGTKNKTITKSMKDYSDISFIYEFKIIPIGMTLSIIIWSSLPLIIYIGSKAWITGTLDTISYILICMMPIFFAKLLGSIFVDLTSYKNYSISKNKIMEVVNEKEEKGILEPMDLTSYDIEFKNVDFFYEKGEKVLDNLSVKIKNNKFTAIVGDSGSGKSTILNLISKYYEPTKGIITIGGHDISKIAAERVLEKVSMVDQEVFLFNDTVKNNIRHARLSATDEEIIQACKEANCHDFIMEMSNGYDTEIGENGNLLSGGQRQRLSIARAILKDSPIILLDEATANLDIKNELAVKQAILNLMKKDKTVLMIAHTLSIIKNADEILVVGNGKIIENGTHEKLLLNNGKYKEMYIAEEKIT